MAENHDLKATRCHGNMTKNEFPIRKRASPPCFPTSKMAKRRYETNLVVCDCTMRPEDHWVPYHLDGSIGKNTLDVLKVLVSCYGYSPGGLP
jgi:hypothetical protein